ncbi:unnamed protein product [Calypogeia fissa]
MIPSIGKLTLPNYSTVASSPDSQLLIGDRSEACRQAAAGSSRNAAARLEYSGLLPLMHSQRKRLFSNVYDSGREKQAGKSFPMDRTCRRAEERETAEEIRQSTEGEGGKRAKRSVKTKKKGEPGRIQNAGSVNGPTPYSDFE